MKYQITRAPAFLHSIGFRQWESGVISDRATGTPLFDYYKADTLTDAQRAAILAWCPDAQFKHAGPQYAPEISHPIVCFPKAGFYRLNA